ncbi:MAG TPA: hypothetical protein VFV02_00320 [Acidimicrobiales bacterium]|nr:hypothetical protein [Acidimicrobiales bacterium]
MGRKLRYIPEGGALVEVICRTFHSHFLLRPGGDLDGIIVGVLGRAQRLYEVRCCGYMWASNHFHLLLDVDNARQLAKFMCYVNSNIARGDQPAPWLDRKDLVTEIPSHRDQRRGERTDRETALSPRERMQGGARGTSPGLAGSARCQGPDSGRRPDRLLV